MRLKGKTAVVTGTSSGMGHSIVELFAKEGCKVVAVARRKDCLEALQESCKEFPGKAAIYPGDVSNKEMNEGMIDFALETFGSFDILINNADIMDNMAPVGDATDEKFNQVMAAVNVYGSMCAMRKAVQIFQEKHQKLPLQLSFYPVRKPAASMVPFCQLMADGWHPDWL